MWRTTKSAARHTHADITCFRHNACLYFVQCSTAASSRIGMTHKKNAWKGIYQKDFNEQKQFLLSKVSFESPYAEKVQKFRQSEHHRSIVDFQEADFMLPQKWLVSSVRRLLARRGERHLRQWCIFEPVHTRANIFLPLHAHRDALTIHSAKLDASSEQENLFFLFALAARLI